MSSQDKFDIFFSHVEKGYMVGLAIFGTSALAIIAARQLAYFDKMVFVGTISFGAVLIGLLAAAAAGKLLNDQLENDLSKEKCKQAVNNFNGSTLFGGFAGMFASIPILFLSKNVGPDHFPEILLTLAGCILVGALLGAAYGFYKAGKTTVEDKPITDNQVQVGPRHIQRRT